MRNYDFDKMLFSIPADKHSLPEIRLALEEHPEVRFVSFVGVDIGGHDTDEKIPTRAFLEDMEKMLQHGVQIGALNGAEATVRGVQAGFLNSAQDVHGLQIGAFNLASHLEGVQIGLLNFAKDAAVPCLPLLNARF